MRMIPVFRDKLAETIAFDLKLAKISCVFNKGSFGSVVRSVTKCNSGYAENPV